MELLKIEIVSSRISTFYPQPEGLNEVDAAPTKPAFAKLLLKSLCTWLRERFLKETGDCESTQARRWVRTPFIIFSSSAESAGRLPLLCHKPTVQVVRGSFDAQ